jgi:hypothetical protein
MNNLNLVRGLFLIALALLFGIGAMHYQIGILSRAGPGLFPLMVSCMVLLLGIVSVVRSFFVQPVTIDYRIKNITVVLLGLCGMALISQYINMTFGIIFLVFCTAFAATTYSVVRNLKISAALIAVAFMFRMLLGLQLPLF